MPEDRRRRSASDIIFRYISNSPHITTGKPGKFSFKLEYALIFFKVLINGFGIFIEQTVFVMCMAIAVVAYLDIGVIFVKLEIAAHAGD